MPHNESWHQLLLQALTMDFTMNYEDNLLASTRLCGGFLQDSLKIVFSNRDIEEVEESGEVSDERVRVRYLHY